MATVYVATNGNDSRTYAQAQSISTPWLTTAHASANISSNDVVCIRGGTYTGGITASVSGSSGGYTTYQNYPTETVNINVSGVWHGFEPNSKNYIKVAGLNFIGGTDGSTYCCIWVGGCDHIWILGGSVTNGETFGVGCDSGSPTNVLIDGVTVSGTNRSSNQEMISLSHANGFEIKNCVVHNPVTTIRCGIDVKDGCSNGSIHHDEVYAVTAAAIYVDSYGTGSSNIDVYCNNIHDNVAADCAAIVINDEVGGATISNIRVFNNVCSGNRRGIHVNWSNLSNVTYTNCSIINNTLYNNSSYGWPEIAIYPEHTHLNSFVIRNNIIMSLTSGAYAVQYSDYANGGVTVDYNLFYNSGGSWAGGNVLGTNYITGNPLFTVAGSNFTLQPTSPAIDHGTSVLAPTTDYAGNARPSGTGFDIGAYEFQSTSFVPYIGKMNGILIR